MEGNKKNKIQHSKIMAKKSSTSSVRLKPKWIFTMQ